MTSWRECLRTPAALAQSGLVPYGHAYAVHTNGEADALPHEHAVFLPERMTWVSTVRCDQPAPSPCPAPAPGMHGPIWYSDAHEDGLCHTDVIRRDAWVSRTYEAALPSALWEAFHAARAQAPAPGQTPTSEVARASASLARILGNALRGETRPVPLDGKVMTQMLRWDASLEALMRHFGWHVAPMEDAPHRLALHPPPAMSWRIYTELAVWCTHLGHAPPAPPPGWRIEAHASVLMPANVPTADAQTHLACARLGVSTQEDAGVVCDMYRMNTACFPHRRQELFLALECLHDLRHAGEPLTTLMAIEQSQGLYAYKDVRASYARLGVAMPAAAPSPASLWDPSPSPPPVPVDKVIAAYDRAVKEALDHGTDEDLRSARQALRTVAQYHAPVPALEERERRNPIQHPDDAYQLLQTNADVDDALLLVGYQVYAAESHARSELLRVALERVAEARHSAYLLRFLRGEADTGPAHDMPRGLHNLGNTCYLNSLLQYLGFIAPIRDAVHRAGTEAKSAEHQRALSLAHELDALFRDMATSKEWALTPRKELAYLALVPLAWEQAYACSKDELMSQVTTQQDVCECLGNMTTLLDQACPSDEVQRLFLGTSIQTLDPPPKDSPRTTEQTFTSVPVTLLPDVRSMYDALDTFFNDEQVPWDNEARLQRRITLKQAPPLLQIHVQRVQYDRKAQRIVKHQAALDLPDTLYLDRYMDASCAPPERFDALQALHERTLALRRERAALLEQVHQLQGDELMALERITRRLNVWKHAAEQNQDTEWHALLNEHAPSELESVSLIMRAKAQALTTQADALHSDLETLWSEETHLPYRLASVCMHRGEATHGHYFVNQRDFAKNEWMTLNDTHVAPITEGEVSKDPTGATSYLVVYVRQDVQHILSSPRH